MALTVTHTFVSAKPDGGDATLIQPSNWNDDHDFSGTLEIANGGTGANNAASARTALGLGTLATQAADNVAITGGSMSGVTISSLDSNTTFKDNIDATKQMQFQLSALQTGQTTIVTLPNENTDFAYTLVTEETAQTLSNKTFVAPVLGVATGTSFNTITGIDATLPLAPADTALAGTSTVVAHVDHVHPTNFTATATDIKMDGVQAVGVLTTFPRADHVHPSDTTKMTSTTLAAVGGAALVGNTPAGSIAATTVQAAINELDNEKSPLAGSASITTVGALSAGSITSTFGAIDIGTDSLTAGSGTFSGTITNTGGANRTAFSAGTSGTGYNVIEMVNTGGTFTVGLDSSTGGPLGTGIAYSTAILSTNPVVTRINGTTVSTVSSTGLTVTGSGTFSVAGMTNPILIGQSAGYPSYGAVSFNNSSAVTSIVGMWGGGAGGYVRLNAASGGDVGMLVNNSTIATFSSTGLTVTGIVTPEADNTRTLGTGALRWSTVYAGTGTINTSDAREKTPVATLTASEINAAKQIAKEIGSYKWLSSVASKGDAARTHIGLTVQRAIEILAANGLNPMAYGFICYDQWEDKFTDHPEVVAVPAQDATYDAEGNELTPAIAAVEGKAAWREQTQVAGDRYAFRYDELNLFIAAGFEARLTALEAV